MFAKLYFIKSIPIQELSLIHEHTGEAGRQQMLSLKDFVSQYLYESLILNEYVLKIDCSKVQILQSLVPGYDYYAVISNLRRLW